MATEYNYEAFRIRAYDTDFSRFQQLLPVRSPAPDFVARTVDGAKIRLSDFRGRKNVLLEFGCGTCAPFIAQACTNEHSLERLYPRYRAQGFEFFIVYTREAHPGENRPRHESYEQKQRDAELFRSEERVHIPIIVDSFDGAIHRAYGSLPNMVYVIDRRGIVAYRSDWTDTRDVQATLDNLLAWQNRPEQDPFSEVAYVEKLHYIADYDAEIRKRVYYRAGMQAVQDLRRELQFPI